MNEWKDHLKAHLTQEAGDHAEYMRLAEMAEKEGCCHEAGVLRDIAREEQTHHMLLGKILEE